MTTTDGMGEEKHFIVHYPITIIDTLPLQSLHQSQTMDGCSAPLVVKFADTQKEKEQKKIQQIQANLWNIAAASANINPMNIPLTQSATAVTTPLMPNPPQQASPVLATDAISSPLQLLQQIQAAGLQQQLFQGNLHSISCHPYTPPAFKSSSQWILTVAVLMFAIATPALLLLLPFLLNLFANSFLILIRFPALSLSLFSFFSITNQPTNQPTRNHHHDHQPTNP